MSESPNKQQWGCYVISSTICCKFLICHILLIIFPPSSRVWTLRGLLLLQDQGKLEVGLMKLLNPESKWPYSAMHTRYIMCIVQSYQLIHWDYFSREVLPYLSKHPHIFTPKFWTCVTMILKNLCQAKTEQEKIYSDSLKRILYIWGYGRSSDNFWAFYYDHKIKHKGTKWKSKTPFLQRRFS